MLEGAFLDDIPVGKVEDGVPDVGGVFDVERVLLTRWNIFDRTFSGGSSFCDGGS